MVGLIVRLLLLTQNIESSPGLRYNMSVRTFNSNGLGNVDKLRRLLVKIRMETNNGGIVLLQETHIKDENIEIL